MSEAVTKTNKFSKVLAVIGSIAIALIGYYQYFYENHLKWRDIRYQEARITYEHLLRKTAHLSELSKNEEANLQEFKESLRDFSKFLDGDFALYHGEFIFSKTYQVYGLYNDCYRGIEKDPSFKCDLDKINGNQYNLGNCARASLNHIRKVTDSTLTVTPETIITRLVKADREEEQKRDCKY